MDNPNYNQQPPAQLTPSTESPTTNNSNEQQQSAQQPHQTNTGVLNPRPFKDWHFGLFDCLDDITICAKAFFLPCVLTDEVAAHYGIGSNGEICFWQALGCNFIPSLREKVRTEFNIPGDMISDHIHGNLCAVCSLIQMRREIEAAKFMNYNQVNVPVIQRS